MFNPAPRITTERFADQVFCHIVDDVLQDPVALVRFCSERAGEFRPLEQQGYPGVCLQPPGGLVVETERFFNLHLRRLFDARRTVRAGCRFSLVTTPERELLPFQMLCHHDAMARSPRESVQACLLYLFHDPTVGGTSFYVPARPITEIKQLFADSQALTSEAFVARYGIRAGYMTGSNDYFRCVGVVPARWNRLIVYDGSVLHSGHIERPDLLSADPAQGRLTLNGFFACRRHLG